MRNNRVKIAFITLVTALMVASMAACAEAPPAEIGWSLKLTGALTETITQEEFEEGTDLNCHGVEISIEGEGTYSGIPLWMLCGWVDDEVKHGEGAFSDELANQGYNITVIAADGYSVTFSSQAIVRNNNIVLANKVDGQPISQGGPLRLVGPELSKGQRVKNVVEIHLDLPE